MRNYFENVMDAHSAEQFFDEGFRAKVPTQRASISASTVKGGAGLGIGMATGHLLSQLGVDNPYVNAPISSAVGMGTADLLSSASRSALFRMGSRFGTQIAAKDIAMGTMRSAAEGGATALVALPIDQGLNILYRQTGMSATAANALSGATSTAVVGVGGIGASVAMGELAFGPEMIPAALLTLLFTGIAGALGAASGSEEDNARKKASNTVEAQYRLIQALRANDFDADGAKASLNAADQELITNDFLRNVNDALDGKSPSNQPKTAAQLQAEKQHTSTHC